jgi:hypothetical protein
VIFTNFQTFFKCIYLYNLGIAVAQILFKKLTLFQLNKINNFKNALRAGMLGIRKDKPKLTQNVRRKIFFYTKVTQKWSKFQVDT